MIIGHLPIPHINRPPKFLSDPRKERDLHKGLLSLPVAASP